MISYREMRENLIDDERICLKNKNVELLQFDIIKLITIINNKELLVDILIDLKKENNEL